MRHKPKRQRWRTRFNTWSGTCKKHSQCHNRTWRRWRNYAWIISGPCTWYGWKLRWTCRRRFLWRHNIPQSYWRFYDSRRRLWRKSERAKNWVYQRWICKERFWKHTFSHQRCNFNGKSTGLWQCNKPILYRSKRCDLPWRSICRIRQSYRGYGYSWWNRVCKNRYGCLIKYGGRPYRAYRDWHNHHWHICIKR